MKNIFYKRYPALVLAVIMLFAFAVRFYQFDQWLYYKWDQGRDSMVIANAVKNGASHLPLLGPRATKVNKNGDFLRLGPAYFYFQYVSAKLASSIEPPVFAYPDLFFSIAVLPMLYLLFRINFKKNISLLLVGLYAFSFIIIQYSRFSWNPNSVPFFTIACFYGLLKFVNEPPESKSRKWYLVLWTAGLAIASQLHYFAAFSLIGISGIFFLAKYRLWNIKQALKDVTKKQTLKYIGIAVAVVIAIYSTFIISEVKTGGDNFFNFIKAFSYKPADREFSEKFTENLQEQTTNFYLIITSYMYDNFDKKGNLLTVISGGLFLLSGIFLAIRQWFREHDQLKKDFLMLVVFWLIIFMIVCIPMAYQLRPRFFVVVFAIPYIFFGFWFNLFQERLGKKAYILIGVTSLAVLLLNLNGTYAWFKEQAHSQTKSFAVHRTIILKRKDGVTLGQMKRAVDYMYERSQDTKKLAFSAKAEYNTSYAYLFYLKDHKLGVSRFDKDTEANGAHLFVIDNVDGKNSSIDKKLKALLEVVEIKTFGQLQVSELKLKDQAAFESLRSSKETSPNDEISDEDEQQDDTESDDDSEKDNRLYWKDVLTF